MKKIWKRVLASVLAIVLCAGVFVTTNWKTVSAEDSSDGLKVIGASIRFINEDTKVDGIRFAVGVKADALTEATKLNYHLLVMPTALLTDGELTKGDTYSYTVGEETKYAYAQDIKIDWAKATEETIDNTAYKVVRIYLNDIGADYYTTDVTARAYYQDGENAPVYSEAIERSYYSVANAALDDLKASEVADKYDNKVGNSYSPYDATQRDALLEVKYEKSGTWDYVDGLLVQQSAIASDSLTDRVVKTGTGEYTIRSAFKTKTIEEIGSALFGGIQFAYNKATNTYLELDYRKYTSGDTTTLVPSIRGWDGVASDWSFYIGGVSGFTFEENTLYDVNIIVTETSTKMDVRVMCRKSGTSDDFANAVNGSVTYGTAVFGDQIRFYAGRNLSGNTFSSKIVYSDKYNVIQDKGKTVTTTDNSITVSGSASGTVTATALNKKVKANNDFALSVDMVWEDRSTTDYKNTGFQIGGYNNIANGSKGNFYFSPKGFNIHGTKYELAALAKSIPGLANIVEKIAAGTPVTWTIVATPSTTDATNKTLITYYVDDIMCVSQEIDKSAINSTYIMYHIPSNATFSNLDVTAEVPQVNRYELTSGTATLTQTPNSVTVTQSKGSSVQVKDLQAILPNKDNFIVQVDMSPLYQNTRWSQTLQGLNLGGIKVLLNSGRLAIDSNGWKLFNNETDVALPDGLRYQSTEFKSFTLIVKGYKVENQTYLDISVKVDGVETFLKTVDVVDLSSTDIIYYTSMNTDNRADMTTTFSNLQITDGIPQRYELTSGTATLTQTPNSVTVTQSKGSSVQVKDLQATLPNKDNFIVQVDMSPLYQNTRWSQTFQGLNLGGIKVLLNSGRLGIDSNGWKNFSYDGTGDSNVTLPDGLLYQSTEFKPFTLIVKGYKVENQTYLDISVKVDGVETFLKTVDVVDLSSTDIIYYTSMNTDNRADMTTTFSNLRVTTN